jgi:hypothetical protein
VCIMHVYHGASGGSHHCYTCARLAVLVVLDCQELDKQRLPSMLLVVNDCDIIHSRICFRWLCIALCIHTSAELPV